MARILMLCGCTGAIPVTHQEAGSKVQPRTVDVAGAKNYPMEFPATVRSLKDSRRCPSAVYSHFHQARPNATGKFGTRRLVRGVAQATAAGATSDL
jgi:hypothetical protein